MSALRTVLHSALDLVMPRACMACDVLLDPDETDWCQACSFAILAATATEHCPRCGRTARPYLVNDAGCSKCRSRRPPLTGVARVGPYHSIVGQLVRRFKYRRHQLMDKAMGTLLTAAITSRPWVDEIDAFVPVPTTRRKQWHYRFRPAELLASVAAKSLGVPMLPIVDVKGKKRDQVGLSGSNRIKNVRGVFHVSRHARLKGATVCLIDDVWTSGATMREMGLSLKKAGAQTVYAAVLTRAEPKESAAAII